MKKAHIHILRLLFVLLMIASAVIWVLKFKKSTIPIEKPVETPVQLPEEPAEPVAPPKIEWKPAASFNGLPGWETADLKTSFKTFNVSCDVF